MPRPYPSGRCRAIKLDRIAKAAPTRRGVEDQNIQLKNAGNRWCRTRDRQAREIATCQMSSRKLLPKLLTEPRR